MVNRELPEVLAYLAEIFNELMIKHGFSVQAAGKVASEAVNAVSKMFGGENVYIPKAITFDYAGRNEKIIKALSDGASYKDLCRKYHLTERRILQIAAFRPSET